MAKAKTILDHPDYPRLVEYFCESPLKFMVLGCGNSPSEDQALMLNGIGRSLRSKVTVASGTGTGKTMGMGRVCIWHFLFFPYAKYEGKIEIGSNTYVGSTRLKQVASGVWKEMVDATQALRRTDFGWVTEYYEILSTKVVMKGFEDSWFIHQFSCPPGDSASVSVAGKHRYHQLIYIDEAAGVSDCIFDVIEGTQTQPGNRTVLTSQGVRTTGRFYETHHSLSSANGGSWDAYTLSSERSPFVTKAWLQERKMETGGRDTDEYIVRVRGGFPENSTGNLIGRKSVDLGFKPNRIINSQDYGIVISCDVGGGEYRDSSVITIAKVYDDYVNGRRERWVEYEGFPIVSNAIDPDDFAGEITRIYGKYTNATLLIDSGGIGLTVCKLVEKQGIPVERVLWGKTCFSKESKSRFLNQRAQCHVDFADALKSGRVRFPKNLSAFDKEKLIGQLTRLPFEYRESGGLKYCMWSKEKMKDEGIKSPDISDAMMQVFLEATTYAPETNIISESKKALEEAADEYFS